MPRSRASAAIDLSPAACSAVKRVGAVALILALPLATSLSGAQASKAKERSVVLGSFVFARSIGVGWGTEHPSKIFNGGDPSGLVSFIHWTGWGGSSANGQGLTA